MSHTEQTLRDASQKRILARQIRKRSGAIVVASLRLRVIKQAEKLEEEATALETAARATVPKRQFGPRP